MAGDKPSFVKRLHAALCQAYTAESLGKMLDLELEVRLDVVAKPGSFEIRVHDVTLWARRVVHARPVDRRRQRRVHA